MTSRRFLKQYKIVSEGVKHKDVGCEEKPKGLSCLRGIGAQLKSNHPARRSPDTQITQLKQEGT